MKNSWKKAATTVALAGIVTVFPVLQQGTAAHAQGISIDGEWLRSGVTPIKRNGRTLVGMRSIFEGLGASVQWDSENRRITAKTDSTSVIMQINNPFAIVNGQPVQLAQAPILYDGVTMVPLRFVSEALGAKVNYSAAARRIDINTAQAASAGNGVQNAPTSIYTPPQTGSATKRGRGVSLSLSKQLFVPGEPIKLNFTAPTSLNSHTRADLVAASVPANRPDLDEHQRLTSQRLYSKHKGTLEFSAPHEEGQYLFRVNHDSTQYTSIPFEVKAVTPTVTPQFYMEKAAYVPGEPIEVQFKAFPFYSSHANIVMVASDISLEHTKANDITYERIYSKTKGVLNFTAPTTLGNYDLRFDDSYGHIIPALSFSVQPTTDSVTPTIAIYGNHFAEGDEISVDFTAFPFYSSHANIQLIPAEFANDSLEVIAPYRVTYKRLYGKTRGTETFKAPSKAGTFIFIMDDSYGNIIAKTHEFTVGNGGNGNNNRNNDNGNNNRNNNNNGNVTDSVKDKINDVIDGIFN